MKFKNKLTSFINLFKKKALGVGVSIKKNIKENDVELSMGIGLFFIIYATYKVNYIAFLYLIGAIFICLSIFLLKFPLRR
ncbi:hypothetical protein [Clostridium intestinale]|uniref:Uncharacterized protein n=1 Tax=Clostridium intestinale TaxID=36845 RepID=A0A7D6ZK96_9CLOT|nr:hypothetical protein [Clostridium intestinale]QLY82239.1 hypothetical protein HZF06_11815 [Clostridium intestinale]